MICCEGNASFYEVGMMEVPIDGKIYLLFVVDCVCSTNVGGFSVLGWNHPGFAESTVSQ